MASWLPPRNPAAKKEGARFHPTANTSEEFKPLKIHSQVEEISADEMGKAQTKARRARAQHLPGR